MEKLLEYVQNYGVSILVIAVCIIAFIGILKLCKVFNKISNSNVKKFIYYAIDVVLAFAGSAIYFACFHKSFGGYVMYSVAELTVVTTLYAIYENCGIRKLVRMLLTLVASWLKSNPDKKVQKWANEINKLQGKITKVENSKKEETTEEVKPVETQVENNKDTVVQTNQIKF